MGTIDILAETRQIESDIIQWRRALHQIPELGLELPQTIGFVTRILDTSNGDNSRFNSRNVSRFNGLNSGD